MKVVGGKDYSRAVQIDKRKDGTKQDSGRAEPATKKTTDQGETEQGAGHKTIHGEAEGGQNRARHSDGAWQESSSWGQDRDEGIAGQHKCHDRGR